MVNTPAQYTLLAFYGSILASRPLPEYEWEVNQDGQISINTRTEPLMATLWQVDNHEKRDFREDVVGITWESRMLELPPPVEDTIRYKTNVIPPGKGCYLKKYGCEDDAAVFRRYTTE